MMVSLDSARQWYPREDFVACNADHSRIAKLNRGENNICPSVRWAIKKALLSAGDLYSEAKGTHRDESRHLGSVDEASTMRRSFLQVSHRQSPTPSDDRSVDPIPVLSRSLSEDAVDQQIKKLRPMNVNKSTRGGEIQSDHKPSNGTVSQWQTGISVSKKDDTHSSSSLADSAETDVASIVFDKSVATSKSIEPTTSPGVEATTPKELKEAGNPDVPKIESRVDVSPALRMEDLSIATDDAKSMVSAIIAGDEEKILELLQTYDIERKDDDGLTPLILAARYRNENVVRLLLEKGANPGAKDSKHGGTTLHWLCAPLPEAGEVPISETLVDLLLRIRPPLDVPDDEGRTPLMTACKAGEQLLATKLIHHGANVRAVNVYGRTPLYYAAYHGRAQMIPLLIVNGAELEARSIPLDNTPLHVAAMGQSDSPNTVKQLLLAGADKEAISKSSQSTPLLLAIIHHNKACVASLLKSGANIEATNAGGLRPLHIAAQHGQLEIVEALLDHGADVEALINQSGQRPLHVATEKGQLEIVKAFLDQGANPTRRTFGGLLVGDKPLGIKMSDDVSYAQRNAITLLLKEAEKAWKRSGKK